MGKVYEYDGWRFVVLRDRDELAVDVLALDDYGWRHQSGAVVEVWHSSAVGRGAWEWR